jgi:hypothetical protein
MFSAFFVKLNRFLQNSCVISVKFLSFKGDLLTSH